LFPEQLAHQPECRALVAAALNQYVKNLALVIDGAPQILWGDGESRQHRCRDITPMEPRHGEAE